MQFKVGDVVKPKPDSTVALASGAGCYDVAVVIQESPFLITSWGSDMLWSLMSPTHLMLTDIKVPDDVLQKCMTRLPGYVKPKPGEMLTKMITLAVNGHAGQFDRGGKPYILHCFKVMHYLDSDEEEMDCIALGHDLIEDGKITFQRLREEGMTARVIAGIRALTKLPGETEKEQLLKVLANIDACHVKLADLRHNSDLRRLKGLTEKDFARMQKYQRWYVIISNRVNGKPYEKLLDEIK